MFGAFAPLPIRLTSVSETEGWNAKQQSRVAADLAAAWRTQPLATMTVQVGASSVTLVSYFGRNGVGAAYAPALTYTSATNPCRATWSGSYLDSLEEEQPWAIRHAFAQLQYPGSGAKGATVDLTTNTAEVVVSATTTTPYLITFTIFGEWGSDRNIGDYGGDTEKIDNETESIAPYAAQWYREVRAARGSAYSKKPYTLVDFENLAIARMMAASFSRNAEKLTANATPAHADEKLDYWATVLGVPRTPSDPAWLVRKRCAAHFRVAATPTVDEITSQVQELLGEAFVTIHTFEGSDLDTPPDPTYWPAGTHGPSSLSIGGPPWMSRRAHLRVEVQQPTGMTLAEFLQLMTVQLTQLLDRLLPSWVTWNWSEGSDGFRVGVDRIGVDAL